MFGANPAGDIFLGGNMENFILSLLGYKKFYSPSGEDGPLKNASKEQINEWMAQCKSIGIMHPEYPNSELLRN